MSIYERLISIPVVGTFIYITNTYAFNGDYLSSKRFAGVSNYLKAFGLQILTALAFTAITLKPLSTALFKCRTLSTTGLSEFAQKPGDIILSSIPSLLGFGIGVYALVFALSPKFLGFLDKSINTLKDAGLKKNGSALMLNSNFAYPLTILTITLGLGAFQKAIDSAYLLIISWVFFWYSMLLVLEVIGVIFGLGDHSILEKIEEQKEKENL